MPKILNGSDSVRLVRIQTNMTYSDGIIGFGINYLLLVEAGKRTIGRNVYVRENNH